MWIDYVFISDLFMLSIAQIVIYSFGLSIWTDGEDSRPVSLSNRLYSRSALPPYSLQGHKCLWCCMDDSLCLEPPYRCLTLWQWSNTSEGNGASFGWYFSESITSHNYEYIPFKRIFVQIANVLPYTLISHGYDCVCISKQTLQQVLFYSLSQMLFNSFVCV